MKSMSELASTSFDMTHYTAEEVGREPFYCPFCGKARSWRRGTIDGHVFVVNIMCKCESEDMHRREAEDRKAQEVRSINSRFGASYYGAQLEGASFENYEILAGTHDAFEAMRNLALEFETARPTLGICLFGAPGNGKSHLSAALGHAVERLNYSVVYQYVPDLLTRIKATYNSNSESENGLLTSMQMCDLLILDDCGAEKCTPWTESKMSQIIEGRSRNGRPIVVTANLKTMADLADYIGFRAYDRIVGMCAPVENKGASYRRKTAIERLRGAQN